MTRPARLGVDRSSAEQAICELLTGLKLCSSNPTLTEVHVCEGQLRSARLVAPGCGRSGQASTSNVWMIAADAPGNWRG